MEGEGHADVSGRAVTAMKPILFNTDMVRAILDGRKTVTRRVVKFKPGQNPQWTGYIPDGPVLYGSNNIPASNFSALDDEAELPFL